MIASQDASLQRTLAVAAIYVIGALLYYFALVPLKVSFLSTPLFLGLIMLAASLFRPRLLATAVLLLTWGTAVFLLNHHVLPSDRAQPVYLFAFGLGAAILVLLRRWIEPRLALESAAVAMLSAGVFFYADFRWSLFNQPWFYSLLLLLSAAGLVLLDLWKRRRAGPRAAETASEAAI
ncbi:MAG: hypothetical protein ACR2PL_28015 [Dehalococcoidia bacterium]